MFLQVAGVQVRATLKNRQKSITAPRGSEQSIAKSHRRPVAIVEEDNRVALKVKSEKEPVFGSTDPRSIEAAIQQISGAVSKGPAIDKQQAEFAFSVVEAIQPRDEMEAMLAIQMAAIHTHTMKLAIRMNRVETLDQQDSAGKLYTKLSRTFTTQMEALRKYRNGGEQKVTVQHVHVNKGGQAVVGEVHHQGKGGGG